VFFSFKQKDYDNPMVSIWKDPAAGSLNTARFFHALELIPNTAASGTDGMKPLGDGTRERGVLGAPSTVIHYEDGTPAIMERTYGLGRVIEFSSTASSAWNDLPVHPVFVPLIHRAIGSIISRRAEILNIEVGAKFKYSCKTDWLGKQVTVVKPDGTAVHTKVELVNGTPQLSYDATEEAGVYEVNVDSEPPSHLRFAAESNPDESRLDECKQLDQLPPAANIIHLTPEMELAQVIRRNRSGSEIWICLVLLALGVACTESVLARRYSVPR